MQQVQILASGKGMIRLLFAGRVVGFAFDLRGAKIKQIILQELAAQGAI